MSTLVIRGRCTLNLAMPHSLSALLANNGVGMCLHRGSEAPMKAEKSDTTTTVSVGSRTTVQGTTQEVLTSGFGKGPGITPPLWPCTLSNLID